MISSCNQDKKEVGTDAKEQKEVSASNTSGTVVFSDQSTQKIYGQYLRIKDALVSSDHSMVQEESKKTEKTIQESDENKQLKATLKLISLTKDLKKQRDFFANLTVEVEKLIQNAEIKSGEIYKQFCPMAFDGEGGYWLSDSKEIRNPYYGSAMLKCGSVQEILK